MIAIQNAPLRFVCLNVVLCWSLAAHSQTLTTVYSFLGQPTDGEKACAVVRGADGSFLGTTYFGGQSNFGTVFRLSGTGEEVVHSFTGPDGESPCAPLTIAANGRMYGTTEYGGSGLYGTVFTLRGTQFETIHQFSSGTDGANPVAGVIANADGTLYGTTAQGGTGNCPGGCGVIYKIDKRGTETVLHSFNGPDGAYPSGSLIVDALGNLYGVTLGGGASDLCSPSGCGTVFKLDTTGTLTVLHSFTGGTSDGWFLANGVVRDAQGNLYGTTGGGGTYNLGTIYEITNAGEERVLYSFAGAPDGANPQQIIRTRTGVMFGVTYEGGILGCAEGVLGCGTVFEFSPSGKENVLYRFEGTTDGAYPVGPLLIDSHGVLYGTTAEGIQNGCSAFSLGCGTVWKLEIRNIY